MNSYPLDLLTQLAPVMFVAGLDQPTSPQSSSKPDEFLILITRLREALQSQRKVAVWQSEKTKTFQIILVDKDVRFPPRKLVPPDDPQYSSAHSPLSPLTPTSPLHPDGLIAPIWIRKHTNLVPSVFVLFLRIYEHPTHGGRSPLEGLDNNREREKEQEERKHDTELASEVALRKKSTNERGIKLTVVLMSSRKMLDDPTLDTRLTFIRRQSGLDSRAALFVLSPVSISELSEFVKSLQQALYEPALEYYTAHSKRVRRKRNRHSQQTSHPTSVPGTLNVPRPLRPEGWTVRCEYKMACFAEFRREDEVALKHYQDAHRMLVVMFGSTAILPPRTKRWAEAKVLADCIDIKIAKLYLYNNEHALAFSHHNSHIRLFSDFSRGWGIGEDTFEYWSWMARQQHVLGELLELGADSNLVIPLHRPALTASPNQRVDTAALGLEVESVPSLGINPSYALQHPGFYYYMAARSTEIRREKFLAALATEEQPQKSMTLSPGFANEKKVDHLTIILELYTKAYELFKKFIPVNPEQNPVQGRLTLWIACRIAQTYFDSGKFDMAMRFYERIAKTYRREQWGPLLQPLLSTWLACAQVLEDNELRVRLLVEMLGHGWLVQLTATFDHASLDALDIVKPEFANTLQEDLLATLKKSAPASSDSGIIVVDLTEAQPIFDSNVVFWAPEIDVGKPAPFQLSLMAPRQIPINSLPFSSLSIYLSHKDEPVIVQHQDSDIFSDSLIQNVALGRISSSVPSEVVLANLRWKAGSAVIFWGTISSDVPTCLKVSKLVITLAEGPWKVEIHFDPCQIRPSSLPLSRWLSSIDPPKFIPLSREDSSSILVRYRPHNLSVILNHYAPAYLQEDYPIMISITNVDDRELCVVVDVLLPPTEIDGMVNTITLDDTESSHYIKGIPVGILAPGATIIKTLRLFNTGPAGDRIIDISVQSRRPNSEVNQLNVQEDITETLRTLTVPTVDPFEITQAIEYIQDSGTWPELADLKTCDSDDLWDKWKAGEALVKTTMEPVGPWTLMIERVTMERGPNETAKIVECSVDDHPQNYSSEYYPGDKHVHLCRIIIAAPEDSNETPITNVGRYRIDWRRLLENGECGPTSTTIIDLPALRPPVEGLVGLLSVSPAARLHVPMSLTLTIRNYHPSRSANITAQLDLEASSGFVVAGLRSGRLPLLMPKTEEKLTWRLIPVECGHVRIPSVTLTDSRGPFAGTNADAEPELKGESVKIIHVWLHQQGEQVELSKDRRTILVLP